MLGGDSISVIAAGLPNITGNFRFTSAGESASVQRVGALLNDTVGNGRQNGGVGSAATNLRFDASNSNRIYGASATVQPPSYALIPQIRF